ncbi:hypothetical protein UPYG_G00089460 [Umbra pygmaea]|uniref:THAP-type domain-containing protein n=1 Tax=Umbra pygmaea TaxID=75934 RepID=A0ABD0Y4T5_UMBPY
MAKYCSAYNCNNTLRNVNLKTKVTFYSFPHHDPTRLKEWVRQMRWKDWVPTPHSVLCSEHFEESYMDRTGQTVRLYDDAIPTIFAFPKHLQQKPAIMRKRVTLFPEVPVSARSTPQKKSIPKFLTHDIWHPSHFHDHYCVPKSIEWAVEEMPERIPPATLEKQRQLYFPKPAIQIKERWEWLTLDVKGPFPETKGRHKFALTVMDYYSKWLDAYPMETNDSKEIAKVISDLISCFGYPVGILSSLRQEHILEINSAFGELKNVTNQLVFSHPTGVSLDELTKSLIDQLVSDLVATHPDGWDLYLAASVFRFCCTEHPTTRQTPLSLLRCGGTRPVATSPRKLPENAMQFVIVDALPPRREICVECKECRRWSVVSQDSEIKRYEEMKLGDEDYTYICLNCISTLDTLVSNMSASQIIWTLME